METVETPDSSNLARYGYRSLDDVLFVEFKSGEKWEYAAPRAVFDEMRKAESAGSFFHARVKKQFKGRKVDN
jgi:hypothetical protein